MASNHSLQDAIGHVYWEAYKKRESYQIIERDDGYIWVSDSSKVYLSEYKDWPLFQRKAIRYAKGKILDIGCGAGRHTLYLQKKGHDVLGIDTSPLAVKICRLRGLKNIKKISMEDLHVEPHLFDTILLLENNFGLLGSSSKARKLLKKFYAITSHNACILAESTDPYTYHAQERIHKRYHKKNIRDHKMPGLIKTRTRFHEYVSTWINWLNVSKHEMERIIKGTGWKIVKYIDSTERPWYIAVLKKEK